MRDNSNTDEVLDRNKRKKLVINFPQPEHQGLTPRQTSDNQNLAGTAENNATNTSACNQSFQFGYNHHVNQVMMSGNGKQNRGGSNTSSTNQPKGRFRSGSNKATIQGKTKEGQVNQKKITINTNNAQIYMEQQATKKGSLTTKATFDAKSLNLKSAKNKQDTNPVHINFKSSVTPGNVKNATKISKNFIQTNQQNLPTKKQASSKTEVKTQ
jgi:hypothetical protein